MMCVVRWVGGGENDQDHLGTLGRECDLGQGVEVGRLLLPPGSGVPPPPPEAWSPVWAKSTGMKRSFCAQPWANFSWFSSIPRANVPSSFPRPFIPWSRHPSPRPPPQPRSLPPGWVSHCTGRSQGFQKAEASRCHERSNSQPST